jgi:hypothetical protein
MFLLPVGFIHSAKGGSDLNTCSRIFVPVVATGINFFNRRARSQNKSPGQGPTIMTKVTATAPKSEAKPAESSEKTALAVVKTEDPKPESPKEMNLDDRIHRIETLQLIVEKRAKLVQTRNELDKFRVASNDFNCSMRLNDSDGNVFNTSFTPGIKKVIDFLKSSFDSSIQEVEAQIRF